jgi:hypothetical protein
MKRFLAFIVLLSHMNTSMLMPQAPEQDVYDANGNQVDDINSVVELIMVKLGLDQTPDDEDSDNGQNFHLVNMVDYYYEPVYTLVKNNTLSEKENKAFGYFADSKIQQISYDLIIPPPKA